MRYEGLKEEPTSPIRATIAPFRDGAAYPDRTDAPLVVARPEPTGAAYHRRENPFFIACLRELCIRRGAACGSSFATNRSGVRSRNSGSRAAAP